MRIKRIIAVLPLILLLLSLLIAEAFISTVALDIDTLNVFNPIPVGFLLEKCNILLQVSLIFHVLLSYKKLLPIIPAWLHVLVSLSCALCFYCSLGSPAAGTPRHYYDFSTMAMIKFIFFSIGNSQLVVAAKAFVATQIIFWLYSIWVLIKDWRKSKINIG